MNNKIPFRINLFGGPGITKSSTAAGLFKELKAKRINIELVTESIKEWAWIDLAPQSWDQYFIHASQTRREDIVLRKKHTHIVTDSPLWMQLAYIKRGNLLCYEACRQACRNFDQNYPNNINFLLKRTVPYDRNGRYEDELQAKEVDKMLQNVLNENNISYLECDPINQFELMLNNIILKINGE